MNRPLDLARLVLVLYLLSAALAGCKSAQTSRTPAPASLPAGQSPAAPATSQATATEVPPTSEPLAATVNGWQISLAEYQAELAQYKIAKGTELAADDEQRVLDELINQALLAQAASQNGFNVDEALLDERTQRLVDQLGGQAALDSWMQTYGYTPASFRQALARSIASAWMRDQIAAGVPKTAEQIHARQILLYNPEQANEVLGLLKAGNDFGNLAVEYDPVTRGDLGWLPRGFLLDPKLEEIAFGLQPGAYSEVVETVAGYHIIQVLEREAQRPLSPEAWLAQQLQAVQSWLDEQRQQSEIQILLP
jgi:peptidyl-prolyl cis-trans isomerase C